MVRITDAKNQNVKALLDEGLSTRKIASRLKISQSSVQKVRQSCHQNFLQPRMGRPKKLSAQDRRACVRFITSGRAETATDVAKKLEEDLQSPVSRHTVARILRESGMHSVEKQKKPALSAKNVRSRLEFARRHQHWTVEDWKRIIWSDETKINRFQSD